MLKNLITRQNAGHRATQVAIFIAHIVLLKWILYTLWEGGVLPFSTLLYHFLGISVYGAVLIRTCAFVYKRQYLKELEKSGREPHLDK